jgi:hypothetical protein
MKDPWDDPAHRYMICEIQGQQNDPAYQYMIHEIQRQQNDPAYQYMMREAQRQQNDPAYQYMLKEMERRQRDPSYRALLESMESRRRQGYAEILRTLPDIWRMQDLIKATQTDSALSRIIELQTFTSRLDRLSIEILVNADRLRDHQTVLSTLEEVIRAQDAYRNLDAGIFLGQELIRFAPPLEAPATQEVTPAEDEQLSAEFFLLDLQAKLEELQGELADNEQLVVYAAFDGVMMQVSTFLADTYNRIRLVGVIGGLETVVVIKHADFKLLFMKRVLEDEKPKRRIGFIIEEEVLEEGDEE